MGKTAQEYLNDMSFVASNRTKVWEENHMLVVMKKALENAWEEGRESAAVDIDNQELIKWPGGELKWDINAIETQKSIRSLPNPYKESK